MKPLLTLVLLLLSGISKAQTFYSTVSGNIYKGEFVNGGVSTKKYIGGTTFSSISIALLKDTLYCVDGTGYMTKTCIAKDDFQNQKVVFNATTFINHITALTISKTGKLYAMDGNRLFEFNPHIGIIRNLGTYPFTSAGDLIFYKDKLYLASTQGIAQLDTTNPSQSTLDIPYVNSSLYGLISMPINCSSNKIYGLLSTPTETKFIEFDLDNKLIVGPASTLNFPIGDASSDVENGNFAQIRIDSIGIKAQCSNANYSASIIVKASVSTNEQLFYFLNSDSISNSTGIFNSINAGYYHLKIRTTSGCIIDSTLHIPFIDTFKIQPQVTNTVCKQKIGSINVVGYNGGNKYLYSINNGTPQTQQLFSNLGSGSYYIQAKDSFGCISRSDVFVNTILPQLNLSFNKQSSICELNNGTISINDLNSNSLKYALNLGSYQNTGQFNHLTPGNYRVTILTADSCTFDTIVSVDKVISVLKPIINIVSLKNVTCYLRNDASIQLNVDGSIPPYSFTLNNSLNNSNGYFNNLASGSYNIQLKDSFGCAYDTIVDLPKYEIQKPIKNIHFIEPTCSQAKSGEINWSVTGIAPPYSILRNGTTYLQNDIIKNLISGNYNFLINDKYNCLVDSFNVILSLKQDGFCDTVFVPTAFSPTGLNKIFRAIPYGIPEKFRLAVYDRFGSVLFTTDNYNQSWDGTLNGTKQNVGVYVWNLMYKFSGKDVVYSKGTVTLIR